MWNDWREPISSGAARGVKSLKTFAASPPQREQLWRRGLRFRIATDRGHAENGRTHRPAREDAREEMLQNLASSAIELFVLPLDKKRLTMARVAQLARMLANSSHCQSLFIRR